MRWKCIWSTSPHLPLLLHWLLVRLSIGVTTQVFEADNRTQASRRAALAQSMTPVCCKKSCVAVSDDVSAEKKLIRYLLDHYEAVGRVGRPVHNRTQTISVAYGIGLIQILDIDMRNQVLTTNIWCRYKWTDVLLTWEPKEYNDVETVRVPAKEIWNPDIVLYNYADTRLSEKREAMAVVGKAGDVMWIPMAIFKSVCQIDITHFPFDEQTCKMKFGSWTYDGFHLDINFFDGLEKIDLNDYMKSQEWEILATPAQKNIKKYPCCSEPYPDLTFYLRLKRKVAFYNYILILPCVLLSTLTLVLFWLPPESPAKMQLGMNIFVAFFLLLLLLADSTPPAASKIPLIGAYYCLNMIMITLSTFLSVIVINLYFRGDRRNRVPPIIRTVMVDGLARILCMQDESAAQKERMAQTFELTNPKKSQSQRKGAAGKRLLVNEVPYNRYGMNEIQSGSASGAGVTSGIANAAYPRQASVNHVGISQAPPPGFVVEGTSAAPGAVSGITTTGPGTGAGHGDSPDRSPIQFHISMESDIREIRRTIRMFMNRLTSKDAVAKVNGEWRLLALVLDRLFFFMYLTAIIISLATIFPKTKTTDGEPLEGIGGVKMIT